MALFGNATVEKAASDATPALARVKKERRRGWGKDCLDKES
jgi:hypothetical protein